jgi:hypothetical protein
LIDFLFTSISLSHGDDARPVVARRMGYDNQTPSKPKVMSRSSP